MGKFLASPLIIRKAHAGLQSKIFSTKLHQFLEHENVFISTSPVVLAADFLQQAGKTTLLHQVFDIDSSNFF